MSCRAVRRTFGWLVRAPDYIRTPANLQGHDVLADNKALGPQEVTGWWIGDLWQRGETVLLMSWIVWVIAAIVLHELGHGIAALWEGDSTPRDAGHMTINPIVHMGWASLIVFLIFGIAWGLMPVNPSRFRHGRRGWSIVAAAGPAVNLLLSATCIVVCALVVVYGPQQDPLAGNLRMFLLVGAWINLYLMFFNLLPVPPLDGATVLAGLSDGALRLYSKPGVQQFGLLVVFIVVFTSDLAPALLNHIQDFTVWSVHQIAFRLPTAS